MRLIHGDALDELKKLDSDSFDLLLTDPPYGISFQSNQRTETPKFKKIANDKRPFIWWLLEAYRITKPGGALLCFHRWDVAEDFRRAIELAGFQVRSQVVWDKMSHGMGNLKAQFAPQHELIWFATKGRFSFPASRPKSVIRAAKVPSRHIQHPNEKPVDLLRVLVRDACPLSGSVCDPFMGSGSTGLACVLEGRNFVGIEVDEGHFAVVSERIRATSGSLAA